MGCSFSGLNALYDAVSGGADVWVNERKFKILKQIGEGGFAFVYLVKEQQGAHPVKLPKDPKHIAEDGLYALKKVLVQTDEQLELVKKEIHVSSLFNHPNLLPLLEHSIISVKGEGAWIQEAYLLFPVYEDGTLLDILNGMRLRKEYFPTLTVLHIFKQICEGLKEMHTFDPPYAHNDVKPGNVLLSKRKEHPPLAVLMDFGSAAPAQKQVQTRSEALALQEWAAQHCSAPYRAPELWDCPSNADIDERTDVWSLGCTLYTIIARKHDKESDIQPLSLLYGVSPFEYSLGESGGSLQLAAMNGQVKWPPGSPQYPDVLHKFVVWMLEPRVALRPNIEDVLVHVDKLLARLATGDANRKHL